MMNLCVIPARGGSKRIPRKNIKIFSGKPIIAFAIRIAQESKLFERIIVSTDDEEVAKISRDYGAEIPFMRPPSLADDHTPTVPVISHAIKTCKQLGWNVKRACCIYPAAPFITAKDLQSAYEKLLSSNSKYVFPISRFPSPIQRALRWLGNDSVEPFQFENSATRTQDLESAYFDVGQFYWGATPTWLSGLNLHLNSLAIEIPEWRAIDIDNLSDWKRAELFYETFLRNGFL